MITAEVFSLLDCSVQVTCFNATPTPPAYFARQPIVENVTTESSVLNCPSKVIPAGPGPLMRASVAQN